MTDSRRDKNPNQYQGWSHRETIGTACHGSARASSNNWTFPLCRCRTAIIKGGTTLISGFTVAPALRSSWTRCVLPSSTASSNIVVGCCFGGRMLESARACKSRCVRLTPGPGNRKSLEAWYAYASVSLSRKIASASRALVCPPSGVDHVRSRPCLRGGTVRRRPFHRVLSLTIDSARLLGPAGFVQDSKFPSPWMPYEN